MFPSCLLNLRFFKLSCKPQIYNISLAFTFFNYIERKKLQGIQLMGDNATSARGVSFNYVRNLRLQGMQTKINTITITLMQGQLLNVHNNLCTHKLMYNKCILYEQLSYFYITIILYVHTNLQLVQSTISCQLLAYVR